MTLSTTVLFYLMCLTISFNCIDSAKILSISFVSSKSHKIVYEPLYQALAKNGHSLTVISPLALSKKNPQIREIVTVPEEAFNAINNMNFFQMKSDGSVNKSPFDVIPFDDICTQSYAHPQVAKITDEKFDLVILSSLFNECAAGLVHKLNTSLVLASPLSVASFMVTYLGGYFPPSYIPNISSELISPMSFTDRLLNFIFEALVTLKLELSFKPQMEKLYRKALNDESIPSVNEIFGQASLLLSNGHFSIGSPLPLLPDVVEVGGMHCRAPQRLPKYIKRPNDPILVNELTLLETNSEINETCKKNEELEDFLSTSEGFIYFSMGSVIKGDDMPKNYQKLILKVFSKLRLKVLWKWETEKMEDLPPNVKLSKWLPQQDLLGHPKIKAFITHGGFGSTTEAVYHGCPLIGFPMFGDQKLNMEKAVRDGYAISLSWNDLNEKDLEGAINEVTNHPRYKEKVSELSKVFKDQPENPLDRALFWTEYVIRHKGAKHLRSAGRDLNFLSYHSIDVAGFLIGILLLLLFLIYTFLKVILKKFLKSTTGTTQKTQGVKKKKN